MTTFGDRRVSLRTALGLGCAMTTVATATFFAGIYAARATPGGETRPALSFAGTLTGATGPVMLTFTFHKGGAAPCAPTAMATPAAGTGAFATEVPLTGCPTTLFDGSDVTFDVGVGGTAVATGVAVNPVPYARYADHVGSPDCPVGYARDATATGIVVCQRHRADGTVYDEVVKVGAGASAFWIDRYEASVWLAADASSGARFTSDGDFDPVTFPRTGQWTVPLYAVSRAGVAPAAWITWFQAQTACRASGKRLPTGDEWLEGARGTSDPGASTGAGGACNTMSGGPRVTGMGTTCVSAWGAQDMIGNVWEWTAEWYAGLGSASTSATPWPSDYHGDGTYNITSSAYPSSGEPVVGSPAAALQGGYFADGSAAGVFALRLTSAPSNGTTDNGFRCVIPR